MLPKYLENAPRVFYLLGKNREFDDRMLGWIQRIRAAVRTGVTAPAEIAEPGSILHEMRLLKGTDDLAPLARLRDLGRGARRRCERAAPG